MNSHHVALLLVGLLALQVEPSAATLRKRTGGGNQHQERETDTDKTTFHTVKPPTGGPDGAPNPGQCPRRLPGLQRPTNSYCSEGTACPGDEMCCLVRNTRRCLLPDDVHRGYCPLEEGGGTIASKPCSMDTDCARHEKCCPKHRRGKCTHAVPAHPGLCPKTRLPQVPALCVNQCKDDRDCAARKKCCFDHCGLKCVSPERHPGEEPDQGRTNPGRLWRGEASRDPWAPEAHGREQCQHNRECPRGERCCNGQCRQECAAPGPGDGPSEFHPVPDFCQLPRSVGSSCNTTSGLRVYYNSQARLCEKFVYRGCGGNQNNFATQLECLQSCSNPSICQLPVDQGFGDAFRTRFYYNSALKTCEGFHYAGHGGNANNFWDKSFCLQFCSGHEA